MEKVRSVNVHHSEARLVGSFEFSERSQKYVARVGDRIVARAQDIKRVVKKLMKSDVTSIRCPESVAPEVRKTVHKIKYNLGD